MRPITTLPALLLLSACMVGPDYHHPPTVPASGAWSEPAVAGDVDAAWWRRLDDAELDRLIASAVARNLDLRIAEANLREARANLDATAGKRLPEIDATGSAARNQLSGNGQLPVASIPGFSRRYGLFDAGFDASWEIDLWGHTARQVQAARARAQAAEEARHGVLLQTVAEVVRAYVDLRGAQARLASAEQDARARADVAQLVTQRYRVGEAARFDAARAEGQALSARAALAGIDADAHAAAYRLAVLTGQPPEAMQSLIAAAEPLPQSVPAVGAGLRSDLLRRRPDIRQAERMLAAATGDVGAATADLFPRLQLVGTVGQQAQSAGDLGLGASTRFLVGPSFSWPIFAAGRIRAQIRAADARADAAASSYERAVLAALADSETALNRFNAAQTERRVRDAARQQSAVALDLARQRYESGEDDLVALLQAQSDFSAADQQAVSAHIAELTAFASLYKALGGGWETFT